MQAPPLDVLSLHLIKNFSYSHSIPQHFWVCILTSLLSSLSWRISSPFITNLSLAAHFFPLLLFWKMKMFSLPKKIGLRGGKKKTFSSFLFSPPCLIRPLLRRKDENIARNEKKISFYFAHVSTKTAIRNSEKTWRSSICLAIQRFFSQVIENMEM